MNKNILNTTALLVFALLIISSAHADFKVNLYTNEFALASPSDNVKVCSCGSRVDSFEVTNVGNVPSLFTVSTDSPISDLITLSATTFSLQPGASKAVQAAIAMPCKKAGSWSYTFIARSDYGRVKTLEKQVVGETCQNVKSLLVYYNKTVNPCEAVPFSLEIENVASFPEDYTVNLGKYEEYAKYSEKAVHLDPGEKKTVYVTVQFPCNAYGEFPLDFTVHAKANGQVQIDSFNLVINRAYDFSFGLPAEKRICSQVVTKFPISFSNDAGVPNDYAIETQAPLFVSFSEKKIHLEPGESKQVDVTLAPAVKDEGNRKVSLQVASGLGGIVKQKDMALAVDHCYEHHVTFATELEKACCGKRAYVVTVTNNGQGKETYALRLKTAVWATLSDDSVTLNPGESKVVTVSVDVPCLDDQFEIRLVAEAASTGLIQEDVLTLHAYTQESCRKVKVLNDNLLVNDRTGTLDLLVQNQGIEDGTYAVSYAGNFLTTDTAEVGIAAGGVKNITLTAHNVTAYNTGVYLDDLTMTEKGLGINYKETVRVNLRERSLIARFFGHVFSSAACLIFFFVIVIGLVLALAVIFFRRVLDYFSEGRALYYRRVPYSRPARQRIIILFLLAFVLLFLIAFALSDRRSYMPVNKPLYKEMWTGGKLSIDVSSYFEDPDNDTLTYTSSPVQNMAVEIDRSVADVVPDENFYGDRELVFTADDGKGGKTDSGVITIKVLPREKLTLGRVFTRYCPMFAIGLLFVVWLVVLAYHIRKGRVVWYYRKRK